MEVKREVREEGKGKENREESPAVMREFEDGRRILQ